IDAGVASRFEDDAGILLVDRNAAAGGEVALEHPQPVDLEDAAGREATQQRVADPGRVDPGRTCQRQGLGDGLDGRADDELVTGLGDHPGSGAADVDDAAAHGGEHRSGTLESRLGASDPDRERGLPGPHLPADTGASSRSAPTSAQRSARATKAEGSCVPMSTTISPARAPARSPRGPSSTASTSAVSGTMTITTSDVAATSAGSPAARAPATTSSSTGPGERDWTTSGNPARRMLRAIGRPMMPRPMNPTRTGPGADAAMSSPPRATRRLLQGL